MRGVDGRIVKTLRLDKTKLDEIISLQLDQITSGYYSISLIADSQILDTEKFVVAY